MTSPGLLILALVVAIAVILFCIIVLKLNAAIGMVIACLVMGVMGGLDLLTTTSTIASGFGNMMTSIGLPVGFGTILGQLMNDSGAAEVIADKIVSAFPAKNWLQLVKEERVRKIEPRNRLCLFHFFQSSFRLFVFCLVQSVEPYLQRNL